MEQSGQEDQPGSTAHAKEEDCAAQQRTHVSDDRGAEVEVVLGTGLGPEQHGQVQVVPEAQREMSAGKGHKDI